MAALGYLGNTQDIEAARADLLERKPLFTIAFAKERLFYLKLSKQLGTYIEGLRRAGIAEE